MTQLFDQVQHIEDLHLHGLMSYFNLDYFFNLKILSLVGPINQNFNYKLFKNLCYQLEDLHIFLINTDKKIDAKKLFEGHNFSNLQYLILRKHNMKILKKEFLNRFPMLRKLFILNCNIEKIEQDAFSNLKQLECLDLSQNRLKFIEKDTFSNLKNLQTLDLSKNELTNLDAKFIGVKNSVDVLLENENKATLRRYSTWYSPTTIK